MPLIETLPVGVDTAQWAVWGSTARLVVTTPARLPAARKLVRRQLSAVDKACSRFRGSSEIHRVQRAGGRPVRVSELLAEFVAVSLRAAERSDGDVDPTIGAAMVRLGHDRDLSLLPTCGGWQARERPAPGWRRVHLDGRELTVPVGVLLDLGATAKAHAADRCARAVAEECGTGVLVSLGGDIATAGPAPEGGWRVLVQDRPGDPACTVALPAGVALATSSTAGRQWRASGRILHHILDPRTCQPAPVVWQTVSVTAHTCVDANTAATAAIVRGKDANAWLGGLGAPARLVAADGRVVTLGGWPAEHAMERAAS
ncbi:MAG TPA: FAD:protein FMN transferase [Planosporangium sp.]|jgi:thiamine biosynthesis lipoprotein|nr:FAD:protein FMN transferase [Planosporangium sp.]